MSRINLDIVIPLYNEETVVPFLVRRLEKVFSLKSRKAHKISQVRYLFIDDGSKDNTLTLLKKQVHIKNKARIISFSRNFGHQAAVSAGVFMAEADVTVVIDGDLQDPPEHILDMLALWRQGYDVVYGQRRRRQEELVKTICYKLFYRLYKLLSPIDVPLDSGDFCLMSRRVVTALNSLPEKLRFQRGLRSWVGFSQIGFEYDRDKRWAGKSKYSFKELYNLATEGIAAMSLLPLQISQFFALIFFLFSLSLLLMLRLEMFGNNKTDPVLLLTFSNAISNSLILLSIYILGAYIGRTYLEAKNRPRYIIKEIIDIRRKTKK